MSQVKQKTILEQQNQFAEVMAERLEISKSIDTRKPNDWKKLRQTLYNNWVNNLVSGEFKDSSPDSSTNNYPSQNLISQLFLS